MKNKSRLILSVLLATGAIISNLHAAKGDIQTYQIRNKDVFRISGTGGVSVASGGIQNLDTGLFIKHESVMVTPSSQSFYINPPLFITTHSFINDATTFADGASFMAVSTIPALTQSMPLYPRTLEFLADAATGFLVVRGTDCYNRGGVTETIPFSSNTITASKTCWIGLSSVTINYSITGVTSINYSGLTGSSSSFFFLGTSSGFALPANVLFSTDVYRVTWGQPTVSSATVGAGQNPQFLGLVNNNQTVITTATVNLPGSGLPTTISISSMAFPNASSKGAATSTENLGISSSTLKVDMWMVERRSVYAPATNP